MHRPRRTFDRFALISATERSRMYVDSILALAREIETDARKSLRLEKQECKSCFYRQRVGGASMTSQPCACCGKLMQFGSTATDALCPECAKEHSLCKHCGGDLEMRPRRRNWPTAADAPRTGGAPDGND
ncbi:hypothetical protein F6X40_17560 [Paraburkholderia sp. UCT31]|uniref:hypothetical protein n=1 Tax=Paraburkholderia sp. UCT31 TaxID=2615209 RepID=UPI0016556FBF|nr:hypothetical protein [Paraburkholderia sp. UCT31]MBC8738568.1 hypothetical protein [Paraburkholderia sp. UCT31]